MVKRKISNAFLVSLIASMIASIVSILLIFKFWIPVVLPSYGMLIAVVGAFAVPFLLYLVICLPLKFFLSKNRK